LLVDGCLSQAAMVNAVITATEAKCDVLRQSGLRTADGDPATGTSTDSIVVAHTGRGARLEYAGPATPVGWLAARAVRAAFGEALAQAIAELRNR
jgi:adenosylcobinamide amidohydrolase